MTTHSSPRRAKIICTVGPSSRSPEMMRALLLNGMDVARFNFSHGGPNLQSEHVETLRRVSAEVGRPVAFLQDLQGPKIRVGPIAGGQIQLIEGNCFTVTTRPCTGDAEFVSTTYPALPRDCRRGDRLIVGRWLDSPCKWKMSPIPMCNVS